MSGRIVTALLLVWELRELIPFPDDLTSPEGLGDALTRILNVADKLADMTATTVDDDVVDFLRQYSDDEDFLNAAAAVLAFIFGQAEEAERAGEAFDAQSVLAAEIEARVDQGEFPTVAA